MNTNSPATANVEPLRLGLLMLIGGGLVGRGMLGVMAQCCESLADWLDRLGPTPPPRVFD